MFITFVVLFSILISIWVENFISNDKTHSINYMNYYNELMASTDKNYLVCNKMNEMEIELDKEDLNKSFNDEYYQSLLSKGQLNCGYTRVGLGIFSKR